MNEQLKVRRIEWLEGENDMILFGEVINGIFSYESKIILPSSVLNSILSQVQKQNHGMDVNECMSVEQWSQSQTNYVFNFDSINNPLPLLDTSGFASNYKQIRA
ncbi:MAG: hypothetical protein ACI9XP_001886 [Lentimonas sp.]|jgi:hypothetical protein